MRVGFDTYPGSVVPLPIMLLFGAMLYWLFRVRGRRLLPMRVE